MAVIFTSMRHRDDAHRRHYELREGKEADVLVDLVYLRGWRDRETR